MVIILYINDINETLEYYIVSFYSKNNIIPKEVIVPKELNIELLNEYNAPTICSKNDTTSAYINRSDYSKVTFNYPNCVHEYELSFYSKVLSTSDLHTRMFISIDKKTINKVVNKITTIEKIDSGEDIYKEKSKTKADIEKMIERSKN